MPPRGLFLVAHHRDDLAGCVGLRIHTPEIAEITRMFVRRPFRGRGAASRLLVALEAEAAGLGITTLRLETRNNLVEARKLYAKHGYAEVPPYAERPYAEHWFEKRLGTG